MPQHDIYYDVVKNAPIKDGWTITHDPFTLTIGSHNLYADLGAQRMVAAQRGAERIAVEIKEFHGRSEIKDLEQALGQYFLYRTLLKQQEPERILYLAVPVNVGTGLFSTPLGPMARQEYALNLIVFDPEREELRQWIA